MEQGLTSHNKKLELVWYDLKQTHIKLIIYTKSGSLKDSFIILKNISNTIGDLHKIGTFLYLKSKITILSPKDN